MYLTREQILEASDIRTEDVDVPEWGGMVRVRGLTGAERDAFEESNIERRGRKTHINLSNARARLVALVVVGEDGKQLFTDSDAKALGRKSAAALERVFDVARRLSGLSPRDIEELTKNSESDQSDDSTSD